MEFTQNLKRLREKSDLSQEELADKIGVSRQSVSKWETGEAYPKMEHIFILTDILNCNLGELVGEKIPDKKESTKTRSEKPKDHAKYNKAWFINELSKRTGESREKCAELDDILESTFWWGKRNREKLRDEIMNLGYTSEKSDEIRTVAIEIISEALKDRLRHPFQP